MEESSILASDVEYIIIQNEETDEEVVRIIQPKKEDDEIVEINNKYPYKVRIKFKK